MVKARKIVLVNKFDGLPKLSDFKIVEEELPPLKDGEYLVEAIYISVDPFIRAYIQTHVPGNTVIGGQVSRIVESKHKDFPVGKNIVGRIGWRSHTVIDGNNKQGPGLALPPYVFPDIGDLPLSLALGVLGSTGNSAYFGFLELCQPKKGETIAISGAAGAVGNHVGQIAKILGCKVIGITGNDEKCQWLVKDLGFDHAINYHVGNLRSELKKVAPQGIDCYFDNVGGEISSAVIHQMNPFGRISVCGSITTYNTSAGEEPKAAVLQRPVVTNQLEMRGFIVWRWKERWFEGIDANLKWIREGKLKYEETIYNGFENIPAAFIDMLTGGNKGKAIVKL